jgi:hypothetical protein
MKRRLLSTVLALAFLHGSDAFALIRNHRFAPSVFVTRTNQQRAEVQPLQSSLRSGDNGSFRNSSVRNVVPSIPQLAGAATFPMLVASIVPLTHYLTHSFPATFSNANPLLEAEVFTDLAHLTLDLATFFGPARILIRVSAVVGRLFAMAADFIPDHKVMPEELLFQVAMLAIAWTGLLSAALPYCLAHFSSPTTLRDGKAFATLFRPAGLTWNQFKAMKAFCLEWKTLPANATLYSSETTATSSTDGGGTAAAATSDDYIYWLHSGDAIVSHNSKVLFNVTCSSSSQQLGAAQRLLGEPRLLERMKHDTTFPATTVAAGPDGATLLCIHIDNLMVLMKSDQELAECMRTMVFQGLQSKLSAQLEKNGGI